MSCTFYFLCQPRNIPTLMQVKHFVVQELFSCELQYSFLILHRLQLQAVRNFVSKLCFQNFRTDSSFKFKPIRVEKPTTCAKAVDKQCWERSCLNATGQILPEKLPLKHQFAVIASALASVENFDELDERCPCLVEILTSLEVVKEVFLSKSTSSTGLLSSLDLLSPL